MKYMMQRTSRKFLVARPRITNMVGSCPATRVRRGLCEEGGRAALGSLMRSDRAGRPQIGDVGLVVAEIAQDLVAVLAEVGGGVAHAGRFRRLHHVDRLADDLQFAEPLVIHRPRHFEVLDLRVGEGLVDRVERAARHADLVQQLDPIDARFLLGDLAQHLVELLAVLRALRAGCVVGVGQQMLGARRLAKPLVKVVARGGDVDLPVGGREEAGRDAGRVVVAGLLGDLAGLQPARRLEVEHEYLRFEERGVDPLPLAGLLALDQRHHHRLRQEEPGAQIVDRDADPHRPLPGEAGDRHQAAHALGDLVDAGALGVRPGLAEARDAAVDDARVDLLHRLVVDAEPVLYVAEAPGGSILMTLAPQSANWRTAVGPARAWVKSSTVYFDSGRDPMLTAGFLQGWEGWQLGRNFRLSLGPTSSTPRRRSHEWSGR